MGETIKKTTRRSRLKKYNAASLTQEEAKASTKGSPFDQIIHLQSTIGNQAVQRLFKSGTPQAKPNIGKPSDKDKVDK